MRRVENAKQSAGAGGGTFNNYQFDFGLGSGSKGSSNAPLKDQKQSGSGYGTPWSKQQVPHKPAASKPASSGWSGQQQAGPGGLGGTSTTSSQSWGSSAPSAQSGWAAYQPMTQGLGAKPAGGSRSMNSVPMISPLKSDVFNLSAAGMAGVAQSKGEDVFGDLLGSAMSNRSNVPMNKITSTKVPFSMGDLDSSLPKPQEPAKDNTPMSKMARPTSKPAANPTPESVSRRPVPNSAERDPFPPVSGSSNNASFEDDIFNFPSGASAAAASAAAGRSSSDPFGMADSSSGGGRRTADPFDMGAPGMSVPPPPQRAPPARASPVVHDPFDVFSSSSSTTSRKSADPMDAFLSKSGPPPSKAPPPAPVQDDGWGVFGGGGSGGFSGVNEPTTTELEGLPPPPSGVSAQAANDKGSEFYKNGQFPDAIKWLSWSVELLKSSPQNSLLVEVLSCRVSCYKEIGEMKKAVADCSKSIELDPTSATLVMLRANLYESMEKYKLAVADLKLCLKIDSDNRQARATLSRLERMIGK